MLMKKSEIAQHLNVSVSTVNRLMEKGEIPYHRIGRQVRFKLCEVEEATRCQKSKNGAP